MPKSWYEIKASKDDADVAEVSVLDYIGMWGVTAADFLKDFRAIKGSKAKVSINSGGGSVFEALAMFNGMRAWAQAKAGREIEVHVLGVAASAASYIAMAGDKIVMPKNTMMFVHNPIQAVYGNAEDLREAADVLDKIQVGLMSAYRKRYKGDEKMLDELFAAESYLTADECLEMGFCDEVVDEIKAEATFDLDRLPEAVCSRVFAAAKPPAGPAPAPTPPAAERLPDVIAAEAQARGLSEFVEVFATTPTVTDKVTAVAAMQGALEIKAYADLVKLPDMAATLIRGRKT